MVESRDSIDHNVGGGQLWDLRSDVLHESEDRKTTGRDRWTCWSKVGKEGRFVQTTGVRTEGGMQTSPSREWTLRVEGEGWEDSRCLRRPPVWETLQKGLRIGMG